MRNAWWIRWCRKALSRPPASMTPILSSSIPVISVKRPPKRFTRSWAGCGRSRKRPRETGARSASRLPAASRRPKARRSSAARPRSTWWWVRKAITTCRNCSRMPNAMVAQWRPSFRSRTSSVSCRRQSRRRSARAISSFVTVQEGCDKFCTFCVVPYTRGTELSRPVAKIVDEVRRLTDAGVREITLIGQNVNAYHGEGPDGRIWSLGKLLYHLAELPGIARLRYSTSHPRDVDQTLIDAHRDLPALMPFVHLPVQSGSDRILAAMNRKHSADDYRRVIDRFRAARQD